MAGTAWNVILKDRLLEIEVDGEIRPRQVFETVVDGDIIVRTDGVPYRDGVLYGSGHS